MKHRNRMRFHLMAICSLCVTGAIQADSVAHVPDSVSDVSLAGALYHLEDPRGNLTIDDVSAHGEWFTPVTKEQLHFGFTDSAHWVRVTLVGEQAEATSLILTVSYPPLEHLQCFQKRGQIWQKVENGSQLPFSSRIIKD